VEEKDSSIVRNFHSIDQTVEEFSNAIGTEYLDRLDTLKAYATKVIDKIGTELANASALNSMATTERMFERRMTPVKKDILSVKDEIHERLKSTFSQIERTSHIDLAGELQAQIDKNGQLSQKNEILRRAIHRMSLVISEELERLQCVYEYSTKTSNLQEFRFEILNCKKQLSEILERHNIEDVNIDSEYENQKLLWQEKMVQQAKTFDQEIYKLRTQMETERQISEKTIEKLKQEKERLKQDFVDCENNFKLVEERHLAKILKLENELLEHKEKLRAIKDQNDALDKMISEREDTVISYSNTINEWQDKCAAIEQDHLELLNEYNSLKGYIIEKEKELEMYKNENRKIENEKNELNEAINNHKKTVLDMEQEIGELRAKFVEIENAIANERRILQEEKEEISRDYKRFTDESEKRMKQLKENYEKLLAEYTAEIDEKTNFIEELRKSHAHQLELKNDEIRQLNSTNKALEEFTRTQSAGLKSRDDRIAAQDEEISDLKQQIKNLEGQLTEIDSIKEKNKKYFDLLTSSNKELNNMKLEIQKIIHERNEAVAKAGKHERQIEEYKDEVKKWKDQFELIFQSVQDYQNQIKTLKQELDAAHIMLRNKEKEFKYFFLNFFRKFLGN